MIPTFAPSFFFFIRRHLSVCQSVCLYVPRPFLFIFISCLSFFLCQRLPLVDSLSVFCYRLLVRVINYTDLYNFLFHFQKLLVYLLHCCLGASFQVHEIIRQSFICYWRGLRNNNNNEWTLLDGCDTYTSCLPNIIIGASTLAIRIQTFGIVLVNTEN